MTCCWTRKHILAYVEGELGAGDRWLLRRHLLACSACMAEYEGAETLTDGMGGLRHMDEVENLRTQILVALSHQTESAWTRWKVRLQNWMRPLAVPATGGVLAAVLLFVGLMANLSFVRIDLEPDVPLRFLTQGLVTNPSVSTAPTFHVRGDVGVEAFVDGRGYVYDFRIIYLPANYPESDSKLRAEVANALLTARFDPATSFGRPVRGKVLLSFLPVMRVFVRG